MNKTRQLAQAVSIWFQEERSFHEAAGKQRRLEICQACPHFTHLTTRCSICGCFLLAKISLHSFHCPIGKW
jgi:hypothetical protein